jgi:ubiquinone biosynthesis protein
VRLGWWATLTRASLLAIGAIESAIGPERLSHIRVALTRRATARLVAILGSLKGAFAKAGQFASMRHDVVPAFVSEALAGLQDRVPPLELSIVRELVEAELGRPLEDCFAVFDPTPLGAASIAQVHRATLPDGAEVAVKVQYPWIRASLPADLAVLRIAARLWLRWQEPGSAGTQIEFDRFFAEFSDGLTSELDFAHEAMMAGEIAANLGGDPQIQVPRIVATHSTRRVLTMSYQPCVSVGDSRGLLRLGVDPADVLEILTRAYAKQIFVDGLFHADPHPGNLFVLDEPVAATCPRVLFVDFGLSKRLTPELRNELRQGIYCLLKRDPDGFIERMQGMGMIAPGAEPEIRDAVRKMFARIAGDAGTGGVLGASSGQILGLKDEAKTLLQETPGLQLPNDLLLYAKTLSYLFALGDDLAPEVDLMKISTPYLLRFLAEKG